MRTTDYEDTHLEERYSINNILCDLWQHNPEKLQILSDILADIEKLPIAVLKEKSRLHHIEALRGPAFQNDMTKADAKALKASRGDIERLKQIIDILDRLYASDWFYKLVTTLKDVDDLVGDQSREKSLAACDIFVESMLLTKKELGQVEHIFRRCKYDDRFLRATVLLLNAPDRTIEAIIKTFGH